MGANASKRGRREWIQLRRVVLPPGPPFLFCEVITLLGVDPYLEQLLDEVLHLRRLEMLHFDVVLLSKPPHNLRLEENPRQVIQRRALSPDGRCEADRFQVEDRTKGLDPASCRRLVRDF